MMDKQITSSLFPSGQMAAPQGQMTVPLMTDRATSELDAGQLKKIQKRFSKYQKLESQTGVPWKVAAAVDISTWRPVETVLNYLQEYAKDKGQLLTPESDEQDVVSLVNDLKQKYPKYKSFLDASLSNYLRIQASFQ